MKNDIKDLKNKFDTLKQQLDAAVKRIADLEAIINKSAKSKACQICDIGTYRLEIMPQTEVGVKPRNNWICDKCGHTTNNP